MTNPTLSVRAFAEMLNLPPTEQVRILAGQKYPTQGPQVFKIPFYAPALGGIRNYYRSGNDVAVLRVARMKAQDSNQKARVNNNLRVLKEFAAGPEAKRIFKLKQNSTFSTTIDGVDVRLAFDLVAQDSKNNTRRILYNFRVTPIEPDTARATLEIAHAVLGDLGVNVSINDLEYVDITAGKRHTTDNVRQSTLTRMKQTARIIKTLWPEI